MGGLDEKEHKVEVRRRDWMQFREQWFSSEKILEISGGVKGKTNGNSEGGRGV